MPYMVEHAGKVVGPFTLEELNQNVRSNQVNLSDLACDQQVGRWVPVSNILSNKPVPIPTGSLSPDHAPDSDIFSALAKHKGAFAGAGGVLLAAILFLWRAVRIMNLLSRLHHPR